MKKGNFIIAVIMAVFTSFLFTSCEESITSVCYIEYVDGSTNFASNLRLQTKVSQETSYDVVSGKNGFTGSDKDAINWFNEKMDYLESQEFADADPVVPVLDDCSATFKLVSLYSGDIDVSGTRDLASRTVAFREPGQ